MSQNLVRQATHWNYQYYRQRGEGPFGGDEPMLMKHVGKALQRASISYKPQLTRIEGHCIDTVRQALMCNADIGVFGSWFVQDIGAFPDFNAHHMCKNFEDIRLWAKEHQMSEDLLHSAQPREGDVILTQIP
jgi:hypothetical protein